MCSEHVYFLLVKKNNILATAETKTGVTLHKVKHQNNVEVALVLCWLSLNFYLASISFATLSMYFVYWFNFAKVTTIVFAFIRNSREACNTLTPCSNDISPNVTCWQLNYKTSLTGAGKAEIRQWSYFHIAVIFK